MKPSPRLPEIYANRALASIDGAGLVVLDIGCGRTMLATSCSPVGSFSVGVDIDASAKPTVVGDGGSLPIKTRSCDVAFAMAVIEHLHEPWEAINEMYRTLKPGGVLVGYAPFLYPYHSHPQDFYRFTSVGLKHILRDFRSVEVSPMGDYSHVLLGHLTGFNLRAIELFNPVSPLLRGMIAAIGQIVLRRKRIGELIAESCLGFFFTARK